MPFFSFQCGVVVAAYLRTLGAYQSGHSELSDEDHVPRSSLLLVNTCRGITEAKERCHSSSVAAAFVKIKIKITDDQQEEWYNFEMIIALSARVGVSIMASWCRRDHPVGKCWFRVGPWFQPGPVSSFHGALWCWSVEVDASTRATP